MSRQGITFEQVELAAEQLLVEGHIPTIEKIRVHLGSTGSYSTIGKYLNEWKSSRLISSKLDYNANATPPDPVNLAVNRVWQEIREESNKEMQTLQDHHKEEINILQNNMASLTHAKLDLSEKNEELKTKLNMFSGELELKNIEIRAASENINRLEQRSKDLQLLLTQTKEESATFKKETQKLFDSSIIDMKEAYEIAKNSHTQMLEQVRTQLEKDRHHYLQQVDNLRSDLSKRDKMIEQITQKTNSFEKFINEKHESLEKNYNNLQVSIRTDIEQKFTEINKISKVQSDHAAIIKNEMTALKEFVFKTNIDNVKLLSDKLIQFEKMLEKQLLQKRKNERLKENL